MRVVDLYCGAGGMSLGMKQAGLRVVRGYDFAQPALNIHESNLKSLTSKLTGAKHTSRRNLGAFDTKALKEIENLDDLAELIPEIDALGDIVTLIPEIVELAPDIIVGGPPCQPWSKAGPRLGDRDPRARLTDAFGIIVCVVKPTYFVMENVPEIRKSRIFARVKATLRKAGYGLTEKVLDASYYGVAQARKRLLLIGCLGEADDWLLDHLEAAASKSQMTVADVLGPNFGKPHILRRTADGRKLWAPAGDGKRSSRHIAGSFEEAPSSGPPVNFYWLDPVWREKEAGSRRTDAPVKTISRSVRAGPSENYPIKANDVEDIRTLPTPTFDEMATLGGFPETWDWSAVGSISERMRILANAVPPPMAACIGRSILAHQRNERAPIKFGVPTRFQSWLKKAKKLQDPRLAQVISEFKAVQEFIGSRKPKDLQTALDFMEGIPDFQCLGASRKSNLRRALRLYDEFTAACEPEPIKHEIRRRRFGRSLTRASVAPTI